MKSKNISRRMILKSGLIVCAGICSFKTFAKAAEEVNKMAEAKK